VADAAENNVPYSLPTQLRGHLVERSELLVPKAHLVECGRFLFPRGSVGMSSTANFSSNAPNCSFHRGLLLEHSKFLVPRSLLVPRNKLLVPPADVAVLFLMPLEGQVRRWIRRGNQCRHRSSQPSSRDAMFSLLTISVEIHGAWTDPGGDDDDATRRDLVLSGPEDGPHDLERAAFSRWALLTYCLAATIVRTLRGHHERFPIATAGERPRCPVVTVFVSLSPS
jgi:hypothetical protein